MHSNSTLTCTHTEIALTITNTGHTCTSKSTDYCSNYTRKCVINYTNKTFTIVHNHKELVLPTLVVCFMLMVLLLHNNY